MDTDIINDFNFLIGIWDLEYNIPKSKFSEAGTDKGKGTFKKILNNQYVTFEYGTESEVEAKGIFAWDNNKKIYRYWWFENSGNYAEASCEFIEKNKLVMNWHDTVLIQTFEKIDANQIILKMEYPSKKGGYDLVLEVVFKRKKD